MQGSQWGRGVGGWAYPSAAPSEFDQGVDKTVQGIELGREAQADINMWLFFLREFNGTTMIL